LSVRILIGDCREQLRTLPDASAHCCVTSPPYFGLRDYGVDGQMGLEPTPDEFVAGMVEVFREVRRVLRDDGTLWLNIGDSYSSGGRGSYDADDKEANGTSRPPRKRGSQLDAGFHEAARQAGSVGRAWVKPPLGYKPKDLLGIPWMLAFALRADGWYLRQDIIWSKPNPMPESVRDRCTKAHEYLFLLSKGPRYHYDAEAIAEPLSDNPVTRARNNRADKGIVGPMALHGTGIGQSGNGGFERAAAEQRNKRSVWEVATQPFSEAHFATYPPALIEPCILAGCPKGGTVLDPFFGAGTTGLVADRLQRDCIGIELNPEYAEIAQRRIADEAGMFAEVLAA
jgi:DNA modification methylase